MDELAKLAEQIALDSHDITQPRAEPTINTPSSTTTTAPTPQPENKCSTCKKTAKLHCTCDACRDVHTLNLPAFQRASYCTRDCQKKHWEEHKTQNKLVRALIKQKRAAPVEVEMLKRAARFLFRAYEVLKLTTYDVPIESVSFTSDDRMMVQEEQYEDAERWVQSLKEEHPDIESRLLSLLSFGDQVFQMCSLVRLVLLGIPPEDEEDPSKRQDPGIIDSIHEVHFELKPVPMPYTFLRSIEKDDIISEKSDYRAYCIKLKSGSIWALDLAGAQFGYRQCLMPWEDYRGERIKDGSAELAGFGYTLCKTWNGCRIFKGERVAVEDQHEIGAALTWVSAGAGRCAARGVQAGLEELGLADIRALLGQESENQFFENVQKLLWSARKHLKVFHEYALDDQARMTAVSRTKMIENFQMTADDEASEITGQSDDGNQNDHDDATVDEDDSDGEDIDETSICRDRNSQVASDVSTASNKRKDRSVKDADASAQALIAEVAEEELKAEKKREKRRNARKKKTNRKNQNPSNVGGIDADHAELELAFTKSAMDQKISSETGNGAADVGSPEVHNAASDDADTDAADITKSDSRLDAGSETSSGSESGLPRDVDHYSFRELRRKFRAD